MYVKPLIEGEVHTYENAFYKKREKSKHYFLIYKGLMEVRQLRSWVMGAFGGSVYLGMVPCGGAHTESAVRPTVSAALFSSFSTILFIPPCKKYS